MWISEFEVETKTFSGDDIFEVYFCKRIKGLTVGMPTEKLKLDEKPKTKKRGRIFSKEAMIWHIANNINLGS